MKYLLCLLLAWMPPAASATALKPLAAADVPALLQPPAHGERIIALWALDCAYCEANLQALATLQRAHPHDIELLVVATDDIGQRSTIEARLRQMHMDGQIAYAYAEASPDRINFLLDPSWGGETPRVLLIRADGSRLGLSGALTATALQRLH